MTLTDWILGTALAYVILYVFLKLFYRNRGKEDYHHLVVTKEGPTLSLYVDGKLKETAHMKRYGPHDCKGGVQGDQSPF